MVQLPQLHDSDDQELMALENQLPNHDVSEDDEAQILNRLRSVDDDSDDLNNIQLLPGGNETNLDNLDKD